MRSNYKILGPYIEPINELNDGLRNSDLLGISNNKHFQASHTNTIGIDLSTYRVVRNRQFAYNRATTRNGEKISIALRQGEDCIVSPSYRIFRSKDENVLNSEYLMMWFRRPEFDRYARFKSHGSAHEFFEWEQMTEVQLPVPPIEKQREIVSEYNAIENRIRLNEQMIQKLEETAQAVYREWFVEGDNKRPIVKIKDFCVAMKSGGTPSRTVTAYWDSMDIPWLKTGEIKNNILTKAEEYISIEGMKNSSAKILPKDTVLMSMYGVNAGDIGILKFEAATNQACCGMICQNAAQSAFLYYHLLHNQNFIASQSIGGAQENLSKDFIENYDIPFPDDDILNSNTFKAFVDHKENLTRQNQKLTELKTLLLSRLATVS
jgi:type I restriction enzyme S subunit